MLIDVPKKSKTMKTLIRNNFIMGKLADFKHLLDESKEYFRRANDERYLQNEISGNVILDKDVKLEGDCQIESETIIRGKVVIGRYTLIGMRNIIFGGEITVGRYCQFAPYVSFFTHNHSLDTITTYNNKRLFNSKLKLLDEDKSICIGNDVWLGKGVIILPGVNIGSGVIIGAGSVVTKDIPDYVIAAGNPATIIRNRFSDELTKLLLLWKWWNLSPKELEKYENIFFMKKNENESEIINAILHKDEMN